MVRLYMSLEKNYITIISHIGHGGENVEAGFLKDACFWEGKCPPEDPKAFGRSKLSGWPFDPGKQPESPILIGGTIGLYNEREFH